MPQADIEINAVAASNEDLPINTLVQLSNNDVGDETTYDWSVSSQPPGTADLLSSLVIENPTITPLKEDTYLIQLIVDQGLPGESVDRKLFRVRRFKTDAALIAVEETIEGTDGAWAIPQNRTLGKVLDHIYDGEVIVAQANGAIVTGGAVQLDETVTIKAGLPGSERIPRASVINATDVLITSKIIGIAIGRPDGDLTILNGDMMLVRTTGFLDLANVGVPAIGDPVFVSDSGALALAQGTNRKKVGVVIDDTAGAWRVYLSTLSEEGGPHAIGGGVHTASTVAELNSKVSDATLDDFGDGRIPRDYQSSVSLARSTTTGAVFGSNIKVSLTTPVLTGTYRVGWNAVVDQSNSNAQVGCRLRNATDALTVGVEQFFEPENASDRQSQGGFAEVVFVGVAKTLQVEWNAPGGSTSGISDARIELWRVA